MTALLPCENCGRIFTGRSDKRCCSNLCAVKLSYALKHNFRTLYQQYAGVEQNALIGEDILRIVPKKSPVQINNNITNMSEDNSVQILMEIDNKIKKFKNS